MQDKDDHLTIIDGSYGQGGGQTLRKSLALSAIHRKPSTLLDLRADRNNRSLGPQPLMGLKALVHVSRAKVDGVRMGSPTVHSAFQKRGEHRSEEFTETSSG